MALLQYEFEESPGYWLCTSTHQWQRALAEELSPHGITFRQLQVLAWLAVDGPLTQAELADRMDIEPATVVSVLSRMERHGWIDRQGDPADKRKKLVIPTPLAEPVWAKGCECARRVRTRATRGLSAEELETLRSLLNRIRQNISTVPEVVGETS